METSLYNRVTYPVNTMSWHGNVNNIIDDWFITGVFVSSQDIGLCSETWKHRLP